MQIHFTNELEMDYGIVIYCVGKNAGILDKWLGFYGIARKQGCHEFFETHFTITHTNRKVDHSLEEPRTRKHKLD